MASEEPSWEKWLQEAPTKAVKAALVKAGVSTRGCLERDDFVRVANENRGKVVPVVYSASSSQAAQSQVGRELPLRQTIAGFDCKMVYSLGMQSAVENSQPDETVKPELCLTLLHGYGASHDDMYGLASALLHTSQTLAKHRVVAICPQSKDIGWWPLDVMSLSAALLSNEAMAKVIRQPMPGMDDSRKALTMLVKEILQRFHISPNRLAMGGFSQGGIASVDVALHFPQQLAGACIFSSFPLTVDKWASLLSENHRGLRVFQTHGQSDFVLPFQGGIWLRDLLSTNGAQVTFRQHGGAHELGPTSLLKECGDFLASLCTNATS